VNIEEIVRNPTSFRVEKLSATEYEELFNALKDRYNPHVKYRGGGGGLILCRVELIAGSSMPHDTDCYCRGRLIYETVATSVWLREHNETMERAKNLRAAMEKTAIDKLRDLVVRNSSTTWIGVNRFSESVTFVLRNEQGHYLYSADLKDPKTQIAVANANSIGSWDSSLWSNGIGSELKAFWSTIRWGYDAFPKDALSFTFEDGVITYTNAKGEKFSEPVCVVDSAHKSQWSTLPTTAASATPPLTHKALIEKRDILGLITKFKDGPLEICLVDPGHSHYDPTLLNIADFLKSLSGFNWIDGFNTDSRVQESCGLFREIKARLECNELKFKPECVRLTIFYDGSYRVTRVPGSPAGVTKGLEGIRRLKEFLVDATLAGQFKAYVTSENPTIEGALALLDGKRISLSGTVGMEAEGAVLDNRDLDRYAWNDDFWNTVIRSESGGTALRWLRTSNRGDHIRYALVYQSAELIEMVGHDGKQIRVRFKDLFDANTAVLIRYNPTTIQEALSLLAVAPLEPEKCIDAAAPILDGITVTLKGYPHVARPIRWEAFQELFHSGCPVWDKVVQDRRPNQINGDQISDISYYLAGFPELYRELSHITFNLSRREVILTNMKGVSVVWTHTQFTHNRKPVEFPATTVKEEAPMATPNSNDSLVNFVNNARRDGRKMATRMAGKQIVKAIQEPLVAALAAQLGPGDEALKAKIALFLATDIGKALLGGLVSAGLSAANGTIIKKSDQMMICAELAEDMKIEAGAVAMDAVVDVIMGPARSIITGTIASLAESNGNEQIAPPEPPTAGLGNGNGEKLNMNVEECVAEKVEVVK
jgi:hypothetical protein